MNHVRAIIASVKQQWKLTVTGVSSVMNYVNYMPMIVVFAWIASNNADASVMTYLLVGGPLMVIWNGSIFQIGWSLNSELYGRTLEFAIMSRTPIILVLFGKALAMILFGLPSAIAAFGIILLVSRKTPQVDNLGLLIISALFVVAGIAIISLLFAPMNVLVGGRAGFFNPIIPFGTVLSGFVFPVDRLPLSLNILARFFPTSWAMDGVRLSIQGSARLEEVASYWLMSVLLFAVWVVMTYYRTSRSLLELHLKGGTMYNFVQQAYTTYNGLFAWLSVPGFISNVFVRPMGMVVLYAVLGRFAGNPVAVQDFVLGIATYTMVQLTFPAICQSYTYDRGFGTLAFMYASPASRFVNYISRMVFHYPSALLAFGASLAAASLIVEIGFGTVNWAVLIVALFVTAATITAFAQFIGIFAIVLRDWVNIQNVSCGILLILSGMIIPLGVFPEWVQELAKLLPTTNGLMAIRGAFAGAGFPEVVASIVREAATSLVYFALAFACFLSFERVAKQSGVLDLESF
jgi:ABC-2 type transport system permease protein